MGKKNDAIDNDKRIMYLRSEMGRRRLHNRKGGNSYIVDYWLTTLTTQAVHIHVIVMMKMRIQSHLH
jgi:hypothetical protein